MQLPKTGKNAEGGFTLVELMIVVAIIGILAAVSFPMYQRYVAKSKFATALAEISAGKTGFNARISEGTAPTQPSDIDMQASTSNCDITITGGNALTCTIKNGPASVAGHTITLSTDSNGWWVCNHNITIDKEHVVGNLCGTGS